MQYHLQPPRQSYMPIAIPQDKPVYRIKEQIYADDELYEPGAIITWEDVPNMAMEPMNEMANEMFSMFIEELDKAGREVAAKTGKKYRSLADAFKNASELAKQEGRRVEMLNASKPVPIMGVRLKRRGAKVQNEITSVVNLDNKHSLNNHNALNKAFLGDDNGKKEMD